MSRVRRALDEKDQGFTLIELLVVIIIIGILSAIAIPVFLNQRKKAVDASLKADLKSLAQAEETYMTDVASLGNGEQGEGFGFNLSDTDPRHYHAYGFDFEASPGNAFETIQFDKLNQDVFVLSNPNGSTPANKVSNGYCLHATNAGSSNPSRGFWWVSNYGGLMPKTFQGCQNVS